MKVCVITVFATLLLQANARSTVEQQWQQFKQEYEKKYSPEEETMRMTIFIRNLETIESHNERFRKGEETFEQGINNLSDRTEDEIKALTGYQRPPVDLFAPLSAPPPVYNGPKDLDWRKKNVIAAVKNQGGCGSCWAFSAVAALEAAYHIQRGQIVDLSEQQLVDCTQEAWGCKGGWMEQAYQYIKRSGGIQSEHDYPYEAINAACRYNRMKYRVTVEDNVRLPEGNEEQLLNAVGSIGPVAVAINVEGPGFFNYQSGIFYNATCVTNRLTHAVAVVGFGSENGQDYWLVRNSWGEKWGEAGYIRMARNRNNNCGIATHAVYPIL